VRYSDAPIVRAAPKAACRMAKILRVSIAMKLYLYRS